MTEPRLLGGRYELDGVVGRGGMAEVYRGHDRRLERQVAVKALRADFAGDPTFQERFRREAQSAASLNHPSIVAVYDTGEDELNGSIVPYIVMEYVAGRTLREMLRDDRQLLPERGLEIIEGVLRALEYSHAGGFVHRDIKPANIMVTTGREIKVMDFGIARALREVSSTVTQTSQVVGTAQYLSPEQARGERVDARSDLYSTGCVLYEILTGRTPFTGDSPVAIAYQHVREEPTPPSELDPDVPAWADPIVLKAMTKDPDRRYQDAAEMRADVERALAGQGVTVPAAAPAATQRMGYGGQTGHGGGTRTLPPYAEEPEQPEQRRRTWPWFAALVVLLLAALAAGAYFLVNSFSGAAQVQVPDVTGSTQRQATQQLRSEGLRVDVTPEFTDEAQRGIVFRQDPGAGATVREGETVEIFVSKGPQTVTVPNLQGLSRQEAITQLRQAGLEKGKVEERPSTQPQGRVLESDPPAGKEVDRGTTVDLVVSSGPATVPDVVGQQADAAASELESKGFTVTRERRTTSEGEPGTVVAQNPSAGTEVEPGTEVTIVVARAPEPSPSPTSPSPTSGDGGDDDGGDFPFGLSRAPR